MSIVYGLAGGPAKMARKVKIAILMGGESGEHEVSKVSARSIMEALDPDRYEVVAVEISLEGEWRQAEVVLNPQPSRPPGIPPGQLKPGDPAESLYWRPYDYRPLEELLAALPKRRLPDWVPEFLRGVDVVFPVLHGTMGEDGTVQGWLEMAHIPYVGCGVAASALGMDKVLMRQTFAQAGIPMAKYLAFLRAEWEKRPKSVLERVESEIGFPCFVKPANAGSSVGITKVKRAEDLAQALDLACRYDRKLLVEEAIDGGEFEISVLGNDYPAASVAGQIIPSREFYDYQAKYVDEASRLIIPAPLDPDTLAEMQNLALLAFRAIDGAGMARVDFFIEGYRGEGQESNSKRGRILVNEINTIPGFTSISMYPKLWEASGLPYSFLLNRLVELALERFIDQSRTVRRYEG